MTKYCVVPKCKTGARGENKTFRVFKVPKNNALRERWELSIPGLKRRLGINQYVCEKHFDNKYILTKRVMCDLQENIVVEVSSSIIFKVLSFLTLDFNVVYITSSTKRLIHVH